MICVTFLSFSPVSLVSLMDFDGAACKLKHYDGLRGFSPEATLQRVPYCVAKALQEFAFKLPNDLTSGWHKGV